MATVDLKQTPLIGREDERAFVRSALGRPNVRFLTLTGPGGVGKTRLALELTAELASEYDDGAHVVYLGEVADPEMALPTIARTIGLRGDGSSAIAERLQATLASAKMLLTLDNLEQVSAVTPELEQLLRACPGIKMLATSRTRLRVANEQVLQVPPLQPPDLSRPPPLAELRQNEAVRLLVQRARVADPGFAVTRANAQDIAAICARLEGLPMAIELAALRLRVLSPAALRKRLATSLTVLSQHEFGLPKHQLTLRDSLAWSDGLLSPSSRTVFHRLSVFVNGFDATAAEVVCGGSAAGLTLSAKVLDGLAELIDYGLMNQEIVDDEPRFAMPESVCEYALERLDASGEAETTRRRHAAYFLTLAEEAAPALMGPDQEAWLVRLDREHQNLRAALRWSLANNPAVSLRLAAALWRFWYADGHIQEGRRWLERTLATGAAESTIPRVRALNGLGVLVWTAGDHERARELQDASLALAREIGDQWGVAAARGDLAIIEFEQNGDAARVREVTEDVLRQFQALGDRYSEGIALTTLGNIACRQGDLAEATSRFQEALTIAREWGDKYGVELSLCNLALTSRLKGEVDQAATYYMEALKLSRRLRDSEDLLYYLAGIGGVEVARGRFERAARLLGAAAAMADVVGTPLQSLEQEQFNRDIATIRAALPEASFLHAWNTGRSLSPDAAVAEVLEADDPVTRVNPNHGLSDRELDVLRLLVRGMSDREIGAALFISPGTATTHVRNIRRKLGVRSRGAAAAYAVRHGIAGDRRRPRRRSKD